MKNSARKAKAPAQRVTRVTMHQISKRANVSLGTVSQVIHQTAPVRDHLCQRVLEAIQNLRYQPNQISRGLRLSRTSMIGNELVEPVRFSDC